MAEDMGITNIAEVRGKDGSVAYEVKGGKHGEGESSYYISKETMADLERQGKKERDETLKRMLQSTLDGRGQQLA